jgi:YidC/Oxa1 family membrane protein insertase
MTLVYLLEPLEHLLRHILNGLHSIGLPWAWAIVGLTVIVRMLLVPLTVKQIHSMQNMQAHAPEMKELQRKYKGDRQKLNEELMKFYKEKNINPASSCLPLLAQFPIFIGLYYTLQNFSKHPPPGDLSWLHFVPSIAEHVTHDWSGYVLLAVYVASQLASTYFMAGSMQQSQRIIMYILPFAFIFVIARFPTGLVLYWMTTNLWTVGQGLITRRLMPKVAPPGGGAGSSGPKRSSRTPPKSSPENGAAAPPEDGAAATAEPPKPPSQPRKVKRKKKARR